MVFSKSEVVEQVVDHMTTDVSYTVDELVRKTTIGRYTLTRKQLGSLLRPYVVKGIIEKKVTRPFKSQFQHWRVEYRKVKESLGNG